MLEDSNGCDSAGEEAAAAAADAPVEAPVEDDVAKAFDGSASGDAVANGAGVLVAPLLALVLPPPPRLPPPPPFSAASGVPNASSSPPNELSPSPAPEKSLRPLGMLPSPSVGAGAVLRAWTGEGEAARKSMSSAAPSAVAPPSPPPPLLLPAPPFAFGAPGSLTTCRSGVDGRGG